jgi:predicted PurR-regulated permease PerM
MGVVVAYILNPLVSLFHHKFRVPKLASVAVVYLIFVSVIGASFFMLTTRLFDEARDLEYDSAGLILQAQAQIQTYPQWSQDAIYEGVKALENTVLTLPAKVLPIFNGAVSQLIGLILFLATTFYLLKDSSRISAAARRLILETTSPGVEPMLEKIANSFSLFLRGQLLLVALMATVTFVALSVLNVKFALIIAVFTGFAEIVPIAGPTVATAVATIVAVFDGRTAFGLDPIAQGSVVIATYFVLRQLEDVIVIPHVMGKITKVHPLIVMFTVLAGGHIAGFWGLLLAVPVLSVIRILLEHYW